MTIESVAKNGASAAGPRGPKPGDGKPRDNGGRTANGPVPRGSGRPRPEAKAPGLKGAEAGGTEVRGPVGQRPRPEARGERSLYDGGSPSANRLGPAKAMRARDVSRG